MKLQVTLGVISALALGIGIITMLLTHQAERDTLASQHQRELSESVRAASMLSRRVVELQRALRATASQLGPEIFDDDELLAAFFERQPVLLSLFASIFVTAPDGSMRLFVDATGHKHPQINLGDREYFKRSMAERRSVVSGPVPGRVSREPVIVVTYPLVRGKEVQGLFGGSLRLASRDLLGDIVERGEADVDAIMVVTDAQGIVLAHPDRTRLLRPLAEDVRFAKAVTSWEGMGSPVEPSGLLLRQPGELMTVAGIAGPDWVIWRALAEDRVLAPLHTAQRQAAIWAAQLVAVLSVLTLGLLTLLLHPLRQLEQRAQHLFDGQLDLHEGWPGGHGEIGRLARVLRHVGAERSQLEAFNAQVLKKLGSVMGAAPVGIAFTRAQRFELVSAEFCRLLGRSENEMLGQLTVMIYASEDDFLRLGPLVVAAFKTGDAYVGEWQMRRADGTCFWAQLRGRPVDPVDTAAGTIWTLSDVTAQIATREHLQWVATHDPLTGLANRKAFDERLHALFDVLPRSIPAELIVIDLDDFKPVNDQAGHAAGDAMLKAVAQAIAGCVRGSDLVVRTGGDEFAVLLERCPHATALCVAEKVREAITGITLVIDGRLLRVGASLGVASLRPDTPSAAAWLDEADTACYQAKAAGRGAVRAAPRSAPRVIDSAELEDTMNA
ncbi:MAG TPA: diguanylate cyclase [Ideonella sp.]|nr:diguanylate cyclase [Ideonella sp.]